VQHLNVVNVRKVTNCALIDRLELLKYLNLHPLCHRLWVHLLKQRHQFSRFPQFPDVPVSAGGTQRPHGLHDELSQPTNVQCPVLSLLLNEGQVHHPLNAGAHAVMAGHQE